MIDLKNVEDHLRMAEGHLIMTGGRVRINEGYLQQLLQNGKKGNQREVAEKLINTLRGNRSFVSHSLSKTFNKSIANKRKWYYEISKSRSPKVRKKGRKIASRGLLRKEVLGI